MPITLVIIVITCGVSYMGFKNRHQLDDLLFWPPAIQKGEYWRFITHGFVHADGQHLLFNMVTLFFFGRVIEQVFTHYFSAPAYALFYLGGIAAAITPSWLKHKTDSTYRSLGASGAVSAILFSYILFAPWSIIYIFVIPVPAIIFAAAYIGYSLYAAQRIGETINHSAHLWGAAYGMAVTIVLIPGIVPRFISKLLSPLTGF